MKKVFIISLVLFFLAGSFYAAYIFLLADEGENSLTISTIGESLTGINNPSVLSSKIRNFEKISDDMVEAIALDDTKTKIKYYSSNLNGFWMMSFDGSFKKKVSSDDFSGLEKIYWSDDGQQAILKMNGGYYLYSHNEGAKLIKNSKALNWLNFGKEIVYTFDANGKKTLNVANPDGSNWKEVSTLSDDDLIMQVVPKSSKTAFWPKSFSSQESEMALVAAGGTEMERLGDPKYGADFLWSPEGNRFLRSYVSEKGGNNLILESCEAKEKTCVDLNLPTIASKCVWLNDNESVICAQIKDIASNAVMPDDYWSGKNVSDDVFWKIDAERGKKEQILEDKDKTDKTDAVDLLLTPSDDFLFFRNRLDGKLYRIML